MELEPAVQKYISRLGELPEVKEGLANAQKSQQTDSKTSIPAPPRLPIKGALSPLNTTAFHWEHREQEGSCGMHYLWRNSNYPAHVVFTRDIHYMDSYHLTPRVSPRIRCTHAFSLHAKLTFSVVSKHCRNTHAYQGLQRKGM